ncbi:MAG: hypothetical protein QME41_00485 [Actinomycetota bacterium]|nr:hypothetical protein [Actinomycetota bacterium]
MPAFEDDFNGVVIDATKWNTSIATSGNRWCSSTVADHVSNPGQWLDVSVQPHYGFTQAPPYGSVIVSGGEASFSSGLNRSFPYVWRGPPSKQSPFPETGDFVLEVRMKFNSVQPHGTGIAAVAWGNTEPTGNNPPVPFGGHVFSIWADTGIGPFIAFLGTPLISQAENPLTYHTYRLEYVDGKYSAFVDGVLRAGPTANGLRPNTIWMGNPVFTHWGIMDWCDFNIDHIFITTPQIQVPVDIKPQSCPNPVNIKSKGVLPAAIIGTADFDVTKVDPASIRLEGIAPIRWSFEDIATPFEPFVGKSKSYDCTICGADGFLDLNLKFDAQQVSAVLGEVSDRDIKVLKLTGKLKDEFGSTPIAGEDVVVIINK